MADQPVDLNKLDQFLEELTALTQKHGIFIFADGNGMGELWMSVGTEPYQIRRTECVWYDEDKGRYVR